MTTWANAQEPFAQAAPRRYELLMKLASGGMATVYLGYAHGSLGFRQIVAIKRLHAHLLDEPSFRRAFLREATLASRICHANVVGVRDVDASEQSIDLVMDYVQGVSLASLVHAAASPAAPLPLDVVLRVAIDACAGLHAAHELSDDRGAALGLVHRDVAPQNILIGSDGVARVTDFGISKCVLSADPSTWQGALKGRLAYMAPEYLSGVPIDRRADVFALGVVIWEMAEGARLFRGATDRETVDKVTAGEVPPLTRVPASGGAQLASLIARALDRDRDRRFSTMREMSDALESLAASLQIVPSHSNVAACVFERCGTELQDRAHRLRVALEGIDNPGLDNDSSRETAPEVPMARVAPGRNAADLPAPRADTSPTAQRHRPPASIRRAWLALALLLAVAVLLLAVVVVFAALS